MKIPQISQELLTQAKNYNERHTETIEYMQRIHGADTKLTKELEDQRNEVRQLITPIEVLSDDPTIVADVRSRLAYVLCGYKHKERLDEIPDDVA